MKQSCRQVGTRENIGAIHELPLHWTSQHDREEKGYGQAAMTAEGILK